MKFADLHLHTFYSDGTYTPQELVNKASEVGLSAIAVTDHDTVEAIDPVSQCAAKKNIEVIPAIELTAEYEGQEVHILGYFIDYKSIELLKKLDFLRDNRRKRMHKMVGKLNKMNVNITAEDVFKFASEAIVGRLHLARALVAGGHCVSIYEAFYKYIGENAPAYVCGFRFSPKEAIKLIRDNKGIAVLAHPYTMRKDNLISLFVTDGIQGLEVYYPEYSNTITEHYRDLADKYGLLLTGGSDCHGKAKPEIQIGSIKIPIELVEKLKTERRKIYG